jgi:hypothetical protein
VNRICKSGNDGSDDESKKNNKTKAGNAKPSPKTGRADNMGKIIHMVLHAELLFKTSFARLKCFCKREREEARIGCF